MRLSPGEWSAIKGLGLNLPDEARLEIENLIDLEVRLRRSRQKPADTRAKLRRLHIIAAKLSRQIAELDGQTVAVLTDMGSGSRRDALTLLRRHQANLEALAQLLDSAAKNVTAGKRGPDGDGGEWLALQCAGVLERHGGRRLSRSYKGQAEVAFARIVMQSVARAVGGKAVRSGVGAIRRAAARARIISK